MSLGFVRKTGITDIPIPIKSITAPHIISIPISDNCGLIFTANAEILFPANSRSFNFSAKIFPIAIEHTEEIVNTKKLSNNNCDNIEHLLFPKLI